MKRKKYSGIAVFDTILHNVGTRVLLGRGYTWFPVEKKQQQ